MLIKVTYYIGKGSSHVLVKGFQNLHRLNRIQVYFSYIGEGSSQSINRGKGPRSDRVFSIGKGR